MGRRRADQRQQLGVGEGPADHLGHQPRQRRPDLRIRQQLRQHSAQCHRRVGTGGQRGHQIPGRTGKTRRHRRSAQEPRQHLTQQTGQTRRQRRIGEKATHRIAEDRADPLGHRGVPQHLGEQPGHHSRNLLTSQGRHPVHRQDARNTLRH